MNHTFCADLSREQRDSLAGSAAHLEQNLLISWPRAKWLRTMRHASDMDDTLKQILDGIVGNGRRINLIHRQQQDPILHQIFLIPEQRRFSVAREQLVTFLTAWQNGHSLAQWEQRPPAHDLLLCCTHGKKDKCCAKYGYQTYKALANAVVEHQLPFDVWESSHLGGCRLAASLVLLPKVRKYGRITPSQVLPFLRSEARNERYLPGYRGDSSLTPAQQCSQVAALSHLHHDENQPRLTLLSDEGDEQQRRIQWQWQRPHTQGQLTIYCQATKILRVDSCSDLEQGPTESVVWRVLTITSES